MKASARTVPAHKPIVCAQYHQAIELVGRRWTGAIIFVLLRTRCRFATLRDAIPEITDHMLSERLQELEKQGVILRMVVPETPVRVEYELTKKGQALAGVVDAVAAWAHDWLPVKAGAAHRDKTVQTRRRARV